MLKGRHIALYDRQSYVTTECWLTTQNFVRIAFGLGTVDCILCVCRAVGRPEYDNIDAESLISGVISPTAPVIF